jgi:pyridoxine kinase
LQGLFKQARRKNVPASPSTSGRAILSVQSSVAYGHVGNAAAVFCLRRSGFEVWPVDTVAFSNHPGYGHCRGGVRPATEVADIIEGLKSIRAFGRCGGVLSGYLGSADTGDVVLKAARELKARRFSALWCCDPVMGDHGPGLYVGADIVDFFRHKAVPATDILVPNSFELELLTGLPADNIAAATAAATRLLGLGPRAVIVTSVGAVAPRADTIANLAVTSEGSWLVTTPRLPLAAKGSGDVLAALLFARLLDNVSIADALASAVSSVFAVVEATVCAGSQELCLVAGQEALVAPSRRFTAQRLG